MTKTTRLFTAFSIIMALGLGSAQVLAEIYKWTDEAGNVHYSDKKPAQEKFDEMRVSTGKGSPGTQQSASAPADETSEKEKELQEKAAALQGKESSEAKSKQCESIRSNLAKIENNPRVRINDGGEMRYLTPEEIEDKKAQYQKMLSDFCQEQQ